MGQGSGLLGRRRHARGTATEKAGELLSSFTNALRCGWHVCPLRTGLIYQKLEKVILVSKIDTAGLMRGMDLLPESQNCPS